MDGFKYNHHSISVPLNPNPGHRYSHLDEILSNGSHSVDASPSSEEEISERPDYFSEVLGYLNQMLMEEEDLKNKPCMFHDCSALQATEKSFYDVLVEKYPRPPNPDPSGHGSPADDSAGTYGSCGSNSSTPANNVVIVDTDWIHDQGESKPFLGQSLIVDQSFHSNFQSFSASRSGRVDSSSESQLVSLSRGEQGKVTQFLPSDNFGNHSAKPEEETSRLVARSEKKSHYREDSDYIQEGRSNKQLASYAEESEETKIFDEVLLCPILNPGLHHESELHPSLYKLQKDGQSKGSKGGRPRGKKNGNRRELVVDLRSLLTQCAQAVASNSIRAADELLKQIRQHSSPYGDGTERLAYYFANAIEARLAGTGTTLYRAFTTRKISAAVMLKAYQVYITACPFRRMSNIFANRSIRKLSSGSTRLHIIDFGILYGFQWPCLLQGLSLRPEGPPKLRITGIDLPQPGFRPAERVEETGHRLANYCERFNIPFEFNAIAKQWDTIRSEDLKIDRDEMLVVNCLYRLGTVPDETVVVSGNPRDAVLNLIKRINPDLFIHGVVNGTYNSSFFATRFREAVFHFSSLFDMYEATAPREDQDRLLFEQEIFGRDAMNVIACEGTARIERPETYKQWQVRNLRAGFRQLPLNQEILEEASSKVKLHYHKDFLVSEDKNWMLYGWKGRVLHALSCWKPVQD